MGLFSSEGVVLRARPQRERDRLVTVFSPDYGRMNLLAPGAMRPGSRFGSALELGAILSFDAFQSTPDSLARLSAARASSAMVRPREDLPAFAHLSLLLEFVAELTAGSEPEPVYRALRVELARLERDGENEVALLGFLLRLLAHVGHAPETRVCVRCRQPLTLAGWSPADGGMLGPCCGARAPHIPPGTLAALRGQPVTRGDARAALAMLIPFVQRQLEHNLRAWPYYRDGAAVVEAVVGDV
ncbi:MAG TPA: DNA repair protein RecO [bacterium]|nr:DNA repair protein RecO [bacterium]